MKGNATMPMQDEDGFEMFFFRDDTGDHWLAPKTPATELFLKEKGFTILDAIPPDTHVYHDFEDDVDADDMSEYYETGVPGRDDDEEAGDIE